MCIDRVKMVLVGLNFGQHIIAMQLLTGPGKQYIDLLGVHDLDTEKCARAAEKFGIKPYASWDEILNDPEVEAVGLFTGPNGRAGLIRKIINAGKHVMTTKPFELDPDAALKVLYETRDLGKVLHLNSPGPLPAVETAQALEWVKEYDLGRQAAVHWETYAGYNEKADGSWYDDPVKCPVAPIFRLGIYAINQLIRLCGEVEQVSVMHSRIRTGRPTPDNAALSMLFKNGVIGNVYASFCVQNGQVYPNSLTLHYERGTIMVRPGEDAETVKMTLQALDASGNRIDLVKHFDIDRVSGKYQWSNFYNAVRSGPLPGEIAPEQIVNAIQVIQAMSQAEKTGKNVSLNDL